MKKALAKAAFLIAIALPAQVLANDPVIKAVQQDGMTFHVTVEHADTGWDHYADRFEILDTNGNVLATRVLYHPHVNEQPFTRSQSGVILPPNTTEVDIRAHDKVHGYGPTVRFKVK